jgi:hypothetical protein
MQKSMQILEETCRKTRENHESRYGVSLVSFCRVKYYSEELGCQCEEERWVGIKGRCG